MDVAEDKENHADESDEGGKDESKANGDSDLDAESEEEWNDQRNKKKIAWKVYILYVYFYFFSMFSFYCKNKNKKKNPQKAGFIEFLRVMDWKRSSPRTATRAATFTDSEVWTRQECSPRSYFTRSSFDPWPQSGSFIHPSVLFLLFLWSCGSSVPQL